MSYPTLKTFKTLTKKGNLIPIYKEILADMETPVSALNKIDDGKYSFLLESVEGGEKWARYCFLGSNPRIVLKSYGKNITVIKGKKELQKKCSAGPVAALKDLMSEYKPVEIKELPRFSGGAVGFFGYDVVKFIEKLPTSTKDDTKIPDAMFMVTDTMLIFDNIKKTIKIVSCAHVTGDDTDKIYYRTVKKIDAIIKKLKRGIKKPSRTIKTSSENAKIVSNTSKEEFLESVRKCKKYIKAGDIFQVVLSQRLKLKLNCSPFDIYRSLRILNPSPYMYFLKFGDIYIVGSSPEVMVRLENKKVEVRPIAGTRIRGKNIEEDKLLSKNLLSDPKECAEHIMLVDLGRNDIGRVCELGSVKVDQLKTIEKYSHVIHIVSNVCGKLKKGKDCYDVFEATFPAGTVSGAPKVRAMEIIEEMEPTKRGVYAGAVGYFSYSGNMDTAISIRTLVIDKDIGYLGVGAGIVADSVPEKEFEETLNKGKAVLTAIKMVNNYIF